MNIKPINKYLREHRMSQTELAKRLGISKQAVNYYCKGVYVPRLPMLCKIAKILDVHVEDLLSFDKEDFEDGEEETQI